MTERQLREFFDRIIDGMRSEGLFINCTHCIYWDSNKELCKKYNQRPPVSVIVKGCESYDEIPY